MLRFVKSTACLFALGLFICGMQTAEAQQESLRVRFIAARQDGGQQPNQREFRDILPLLKNLRFGSFQSVADTTMPLRAGATASLRYGYRIKLATVKSNMATVHVVRNKRALLSTRLKLQPGKPVLLGGFPHEGDTTLIIVLTLPHPRGRTGGR